MYRRKTYPTLVGSRLRGPGFSRLLLLRGILHNHFYTGKVRHKEEVLPGAHEDLVSEDVFEAVQLALKRNSGRSETLHTRPAREYLLKGLIRCIYCGMPMWAQTLKSGNPYYREQNRSRYHMECPGDGKSIRCEIPDEQIGCIVGALLLPEAWLDRVLAQVHLADEAKRISEERKEVQCRLKRLGQVYLDNLITVEEYHRQKRILEDRLTDLIAPAVDVTEEAGKLLENQVDSSDQAQAILHAPLRDSDNQGWQ